MSRVTFGCGATVGLWSVVLYDAAIARGAKLEGISLAMKIKTRLAATAWCGIPARLGQ